MLLAAALLLPGPARSAEIVVTIGEFFFRPTNIIIAPGDTVRWVNQGFGQHDATARDGTFASPLLRRNESFSYTFNTPGVFPYHCLTHVVMFPQQTGTVTVAAMNLPPAVQIASPSVGARFTAPAGFTIAANASDSDGTVASVQFLVNGSAVGTATSPPYTTSVNGLPAGSYTLTAVATDNSGALATSDPIVVLVEELPPEKHTLTVGISPPGSGTVTLQPPQPPEGYVAGTMVTLTAAASDGFAFSNWTGAASGTVNPIEVTMDSDRNVTAQFVPTVAPSHRLLLMVNPPGSGTVEASPAPNGPNGTYLHGTLVTLTASAAVNHAFSNWNDAASSTSNSITVLMDAERSVTANFVESLTPTFTLVVATNPPGAGSINISPPPNGTNGTYLEGTLVTLTATALGTNLFTNWSGAISSTSNRITLVLDRDRSVTAHFVPIIPPSYTLVVEVSPSHAGAVLMNPTSPESTFPGGTPVALAAQPNAGFRFARWSGAVTSTSNPIVLVMTADRIITAVFEPIPSLHFAELNGAWAGLLLDASETNFTTSGFITLRVAKTGAYRGVAKIGGRRELISGQFDRFGYAPLVARGATLTGSLQIQSEPLRMTGLLTDGRKSPALLLFRRENGTNSAGLAGSHLAMLSAPAPVNAEIPLRFDVAAHGVVRVRGVLADGAAVNVRTFVAGGLIPLHVPLYRNRGALLGWVLLLDGGMIHGELHWHRPGDSRSVRFPDGFSIIAPLAGSHSH